MDEYPVLSSESIFTGRVLTLRTEQVRMSDGTVVTREIVGHPGAVAIVALDEDENVVLVRQYRVPARRYLEELPAGLLDVAGEPSLLAAQRELFEEAALQADEWHVLLDIFTSPGMSEETIRVFLARGLHGVPETERFVPEHEEITLTVRRVPLTEAVQMALRGELNNAPAVAGVLAAQAARSEGWNSLRPAQTPEILRADPAGS